MLDKNIGIFDSGVGGLTIVKNVLELLPNENIVYLGDTARVPYGSRDDKTILKYGFQDINFLKSKNTKIIVAACGTVSSVFFKNNMNGCLHESCNFIGIIEPTSNLAAETSKNRNIGIIGTKATINSKSYEICLKNLDKDISTISQACPLFVPIVEEGIFKSNPDIAYKIIDLYLNQFKKFNIDTLILGCTHYPLLAELISNYFDDKINLINPGVATAKFIKTYLEKNNMLNYDGTTKEFFVTDSIDGFKNIAMNFLNLAEIKSKIKNVNLTEIDK